MKILNYKLTFSVQNGFRNGLIRIFVSLVVAQFALNLSAQNLSQLKTVREADSLFKREQYKAALLKYEASFKSGNTYCDDYYNAARCAAVLKNSPLAIKYIKLSIQNGFIDESYIGSDYYFRSLNFLSLEPTLKPLFDSQKSKIESALAKIKDVPCLRLIPFYSKGLWGYMDSKDTSIVVKPIFKSLGFMTEYTWIKYKSSNINIHISNKGKIKNVYTFMDDLMEASDIAGEPYFNKESSANGYKGFKHSNGYIQKHSDYYSRLMGYTVLIKKKHYAIAYIGESVALIDEEGHTLKGFDFSDSLTEIHKAYDCRDSIVWMWFTDKSGGTGFRSEQGITAHYNVFKTYPGFGHKISSHYAFDTTKQGQYGVFDIWTLKWVVEPQALEILDVVTHRKDCQMVVNYTNAYTLYFLVKTPEGDMYYIDEKLREYRVDYQN